MCVAKAPCSSAVRSARAVIEEVPAAASSSVQQLARCALDHAERDVQAMSQRCNLTIPLPISEVLGHKDEPIPFIKASEWCNFFMNMNLWFHLSGLREPNEEGCCQQWAMFWDRYKAICPEHPIYKKPLHVLRRTAALILHGDEGRSRKKTAIMILSFHSALGHGSRPSGPAKLDSEEQELNFIGHTWATRFLLSVLPRCLYDDSKAGNFQTVVKALVDDFNSLFNEGFVSMSGERHYVTILNVIGDWPFLKKAFGWNRSFENAAKHAAARTTPKGICHVCLADQPGFPFEDFESAEPRWRRTVNVQPAYIVKPPLLELPHDAADPAHFAGQDLFHAWHLGYGKVFISSVIALLSALFPGSSVNAKFEAMSTHLFTFCRTRGEQPYLRKLTRDTISWSSTTDYPSGSWAKGSTTLCLTRWVLECFGDFRDQILPGSMLMLAWLATLEIHRFFSKLYRQKLWLTRESTMNITRHGFEFLRLNGRLAQKAFQEGRALFLFMPNLHRLHHVFFLMHDQASRAEYTLSPLIHCCQVEEDFIGRPSRVSRRVSPRLAALRTLQRSLMATHSHFVDAGLLRKP